MPSNPSRARLLFAERLKKARLALGISQKELGLRVGLTDDVASTRINRYEKSRHDADWETVEKLAAELGVPMASLFADTSDLAEAISIYAKMSKAKRDKAIKMLRELAASPPTRKPKA